MATGAPPCPAYTRPATRQPSTPARGEMPSAPVASGICGRARPRRLSAMPQVVEIDTPHGPARAHIEAANKARGALVLGHGAGGGVRAGPRGGVRGRACGRVHDRPRGAALPGSRAPLPCTGAPTRRRLERGAGTLDLEASPLVVGGRRSARGSPAAPSRARSGRRSLPRLPAATAATLGTAAEPPAGARGGEGPAAGGTGRAGPVRDAAGGPRADGGAGAETTASVRTRTPYAAVRAWLRIF